MFTGLVEGAHPVVARERGEAGLELTVDLEQRAAGVALGDSIAVNGCCLTVSELDGSRVRFHAGEETLDLTALADLAVGDRVNVERSLRLGDPLGGHLVSGHVDGTALVHAVEPEPSQTVMSFELPERLAGEVILKGSIALDGVSLTVTAVRDRVVSAALIPHTLEITNLGTRRVGDRINVETDMLGKWIARQAAPVMEELRRRARPAEEE